MRILKFERLNQIITISSVRIDNRILDRLLVTDALYIRFSDYVKSQLHLNLVSDLYHRDVGDYFDAYQYLTGNTAYLKECLRVVRYFYHDMAHFLINNRDVVEIELVVDAPNIESLNLKEGSMVAQQALQEIIDSVDSDNLIKIIEGSEYSFLLDYVEGIDDLKVKLSSYSVAAFILKSLSGGVYENNSQ